MQIKNLLPLALATAAAAQDMNLTAALSDVSELSSLTSILQGFEELVGQLSTTENITLLAPSNEAIEEFASASAGDPFNDPETVQAILQYHVLNGTFESSAISDTSAFIPTLLTDEAFSLVTGGQVVEAVTIDDEVTFFSGLLTNSTVTEADITYNNGVVHVIDRLLIPPVTVSFTAVASNLTSLVGALNSTELGETVDTTPDVTIFAPSNMAFQAIGSGFGNMSMEDLSSILTYHVVNGTVGYSSDLTNTSLETVNGANVTISVEDGAVYVNSARVVLPDVLVSNGVVHVIDALLNPENATATRDPTQSTQEPAFTGVSSATEEPFTSDVPTPTAPAPSRSAGGEGGDGGDGSEDSSSTNTNGAVAAMPMKTGAVGAAALFGGAALVYNM